MRGWLLLLRMRWRRRRGSAAAAWSWRRPPWPELLVRHCAPGPSGPEVTELGVGERRRPPGREAPLRPPPPPPPPPAPPRDADGRARHAAERRQGRHAHSTQHAAAHSASAASFLHRRPRVAPPETGRARARARAPARPSPAASSPPPPPSSSAASRLRPCLCPALSASLLPPRAPFPLPSSWGDSIGLGVGTRRGRWRREEGVLLASVANTPPRLNDKRLHASFFFL